MLCTTLLAASFGFGKRAHELASSGARGEQQRAVLARYHPTYLKLALYATGGATVLAYLFYTLAEHTRDYFHTTNMVWTAPAVAVGVTRFVHLSATRQSAESPTEEILRDPLFIANLVAWVVAVVTIIYFAR
jgi:hypothetical protein